MPVEVKKYTCQFRCHHKAISSLRRMESHESKCWNNPENKTCKTCVNQIAYTELDDYQPVRSCKLQALADFFDTVHHRLRPDETKMQIRPIYNCAYHNREAGERLPEFVDELTKEFGTTETGTYHFPYYIPSEKPKEETDFF